MMYLNIWGELQEEDLHPPFEQAEESEDNQNALSRFLNHLLGKSKVPQELEEAENEQ